MLGAALIVLLTVAAYLNSFSGALVYDDRASITENASIRLLWPLTTPLTPPAESGTGGRPVANLTFAVSYALSGLAPLGHHVVNLTTHLLAALTLFGVLRRTLLQPTLRARFAADPQNATFLGVTIALLWAVHPLQPQVVTYLSQRTESLMAFFYLLTLYCFIRGTEERPRLWHPLAVLACLLGALSKEVIATVPVVVFLYDRTFVAGSFAGAWRQRWKLHVALAASWLPLAFLLIGVRDRGVGYGLGIPWFDYLLTECKAVVTYASLGLWPHPLIFDRGATLVKGITEAAPFALVLGLLLTGTLWALRSRPALGFAGAWFFVILSPTSSIVPVIQQPIAENRPYLPLAAILSLGVLGLHALLGRRSTLVVCGVIAAACLFTTAARNRAFQSEISIWSDTIAKAPQNPRAHYNLGVALNYTNRIPEAIASYEAALRINPAYPDAHNNLGNALAEQGRIAEAFPHLETALRLRPAYPDAHYNLGNAYLHTRRPAEAIGHYQASLRIDKNQPKARNNLGIAFLQTQRVPDAIREFELALTLSPTFPDPHNNLAVALSQSGRLAEAIAHCEIALRLKPDYVGAQQNLESLRARQRLPDAKP